MKNPTFYVFMRLLLLPLTAIQSFAQSTYESYTFTTLAGGGGYRTSVAGSTARISNPAGLAADTAGNVYVADTFNHAIRKVTPEGVVTTLAGKPGTSGNADGTGSDARFFYPDKLAVDNAGNLYVSDNENHTIRSVTPAGVVATIAGRAGVAGSANGTNSAARFNFPEGVAVDSVGNVFVADSGNCTIRKLTPIGTNWVVTTLAGRAGLYGSVDGTNAAARFNWSQGLAIDGVGNLYVADTDNHTIRKVTPVGTNWVVTTLAGNPSIKDPLGNPIGGYFDGINNSARFSAPKGIAVDIAGNIYVADESNHALRQVTLVGTNWVVTTMAGLAGNPGTADGTNSAARFNFPYGVAVDSSGNVYVADLYNDSIRKLLPTGTNWVVSTLAGLGGVYGSADGPGNSALFRGPSAIVVDSAGIIFAADQKNHTIRKVTAAGEVTTIAGLAGYAGSVNGTNSDARFNSPAGVAVDSTGKVYVIERGNGTIRKATPVGTNWVVTTVATDFGEPRGLAVDGAGNLYVANSGYHTIDKVSPAGVVTTMAGAAGSYGSANGTGTAARFKYPTSVAVDGATNLYVADTGNHTIRKVTRGKVVTTLAGMVGDAGNADGIGNSARFNYPSGIAVDSAGNLYVADAYNNTLRRLKPLGTDWAVTTLGGMSGFYGTADGTGIGARFGNPSGVAVDGVGNVYVADYFFNAIRKGFPTPRIVNPGFSAGRFGFDLSGPSGRTVVVEAYSEQVNWLPIWTNAFGADVALRFIDVQSGSTPKRFYRTRLP